ncbi:cell division protein ZapA [Paraliobacillus quinghaiensis]|uniref:Cell division protein ZapA n=1 Tax=Paraliobacillus quinghaiensis TaxID=470815 RepID=A0A917TKS6_9BACI|nr:cell division protein ZapA [Paraliobacillus quinghaiensis]GGM26962.1 cell division protein ZapA [Paraliobacillus quinghaiensis]
MSQAKKTRTTVDIYGKDYTIVGDESARHVRMVSSLVDEKMREIHEANKSLDTTKLAVLTAVNTMNDYLELQKQYQELKSSIQQKEDKQEND